MTLLWDTPAGHPIRALLQDTLQKHCYKALSYDTLVGRLFAKTFLLGHFSRALMSKRSGKLDSDALLQTLREPLGKHGGM